MQGGQASTASSTLQNTTGLDLLAATERLAAAPGTSHAYTRATPMPTCAARRCWGVRSRRCRSFTSSSYSELYACSLRQAAGGVLGEE